jgi:hypothetical protein
MCRAALEAALEEIEDRLPAVHAGVTETECRVLAAGIGDELEGLVFVNSTLSSAMPCMIISRSRIAPA